MSIYEDRLRSGKKTELSNRITSTIAEDIWCMSYIVEDTEEFVDYLMTITNSEAIEEFFNKCHDEGGRFCGGSSGSGRGPGTHKPAPIDYVKQQVREKVGITAKRRNSAALQRVTTSPGRRVADLVTGLGFNPGGLGSVKIRRLQKAQLSNFGTKDLGALKTRLQASQRQYNNMHTMGWATVATMGTALGVARTVREPVLTAAILGGAAVTIGIARYKTRRIPAQIERIDREVSKRSKLSADGSVELAIEGDDFPTLAEEIAMAKKEIEGGNYPKDSKLSSEGLKDVENLLSDIDEDDDLTSEQIKAVKEFFAKAKKSN